jgi:hypothetical protein
MSTVIAMVPHLLAWASVGTSIITATRLSERV